MYQQLSTTVVALIFLLAFLRGSIVIDISFSYFHVRNEQSGSDGDPDSNMQNNEIFATIRGPRIVRRRETVTACNTRHATHLPSGYTRFSRNGMNGLRGVVSGWCQPRQSAARSDGLETGISIADPRLDAADGLTHVSMHAGDGLGCRLIAGRNLRNDARMSGWPRCPLSQFRTLLVRSTAV